MEPPEKRRNTRVRRRVRRMSVSSVPILALITRPGLGHPQTVAIACEDVFTKLDILLDDEDHRRVLAVLTFLQARNAFAS